MLNVRMSLYKKYKLKGNFIHEVYIESKIGNYKQKIIYNKDLEEKAANNIFEYISFIIDRQYNRRDRSYLTTTLYMALSQGLITDMDWEIFIEHGIKGNMVTCQYNLGCDPTVVIDLRILEKDIEVDYFLGYLRLNDYTDVSYN